MDWLGLAAGRVQLHGSSDISSCHTSQPLLGWLFCHPLLTLVTGELLRVAVTQLRQLVTRELLLRELCTRTTQPRCSLNHTAPISRCPSSASLREMVPRGCFRQYQSAPPRAAPSPSPSPGAPARLVPFAGEVGAGFPPRPLAPSAAPFLAYQRPFSAALRGLCAPGWAGGARGVVFFRYSHLKL